MVSLASGADHPHRRGAGSMRSRMIRLMATQTQWCHCGEENRDILNCLGTLPAPATHLVRIRFSGLHSHVSIRLRDAGA